MPDILTVSYTHLLFDIEYDDPMVFNANNANADNANNENKGN